MKADLSIMSVKVNEKKLSISVDIELIAESKEDVEKIQDIKKDPGEFNKKIGKSLSRLVRRRK